MPRDDLVQYRRGTQQQWDLVDPVLDDGEPGYAYDTLVLKVGDGTSKWSELVSLNAPKAIEWSDVLDKPSTFPPSSHQHSLSDVPEAESKTGSQVKADLAYNNAIQLSATDATTKAASAYTQAVQTASTDATTKATNARDSAIIAAAIDASNKSSSALAAAGAESSAQASAARVAAIAAAAVDATTKAGNAKTEALAAAALDATAKANAAQAAAQVYADTQASAAEADAIADAVARVAAAATSASDDASNKANVARGDAISAAALDATNKVAAERNRAVAVEQVKADLVDGKIPSSQIPALATHETALVDSRAAMLALTSADVQPGDEAIIGQTGAQADRGRWLLLQLPISSISSWMRLSAPGGVQTVNGQTGDNVVIGASDVGAPTFTELANEVTRAKAAEQVNAASIATHVLDSSNPHLVTKSQVGLSNVPNIDARDRSTHVGTQSLDTTIDSATRLALLPDERSKLAGVAANATANATDAQLRDRSTHTGTQSLDTTIDSDARLAFTPAERALLSGAVSIATANTLARRDASGKATFTTVYSNGAQENTTTALTRKDYVDTSITSARDRATHTGTQTLDTTTDSTSRLALLPAERTKLSALGFSGARAVSNTGVRPTISTLTTLSWEVEQYDIGDYFTPGGSRLTAARAGVYDVIASVTNLLDGIITITDDYSTNPLTSTPARLTFTGGTWAYDATNQYVQQTDTSANQRFAYLSYIDRRASFDFSVDFQIVSDSQGIKHSGLFLQSVDSAAVTGLRITHYNAQWNISPWTGGTEGSSIAQLPDAVAFAVGTTYRVRVAWNGVSSTGTLYVNGTRLGDFTASSGYASLRPGYHSYGCVSRYDNVSYTSPETADRVAVQIVKNGSTVLAVDDQLAPTPLARAITSTAVTEVQLAAGDYVEARALMSGGRVDPSLSAFSIAAPLGGYATSTDVQAFATPGSFTWTKPAGAKTVRAIVYGAGGGGGSGRSGAAATLRGGGGGGGGGGYSLLDFDGTQLGTTETITVGAGGAGGGAQTNPDTNGNSGSTGGQSDFGGRIVASGGAGATGGTSSSGGNAGNPGTSAMFPGTSGTGGASTTAATQPGGNVGCCGGAGGGGITAADVTTAAGPSNTNNALTAGTGRTAGLANAGDTTVATRDSTIRSSWGPGSGGAGGGSGTTTAAGRGGNGLNGAGGGGGGASLNGFASGKGGNGGNGLVVVITTF